MFSYVCSYIHSASYPSSNSGSYLYQVAGDLKYADRVERITYNALPATLTGNMWSRQYLQQQNQIAAKNMNPYVSSSVVLYSVLINLAK